MVTCYCELRSCQIWAWQIRYAIADKQIRYKILWNGFEKEMERLFICAKWNGRYLYWRMLILRKRRLEWAFQGNDLAIPANQQCLRGMNVVENVFCLVLANRMHKSYMIIPNLEV